MQGSIGVHVGRAGDDREVTPRTSAHHFLIYPHVAAGHAIGREPLLEPLTDLPPIQSE
jgi:hypothetical protein